jgi:hypothetical protein
MIGCNKSGESSDYDSVIEVAKEKGIAEISKEVQQPDWYQCRLDNSLGKSERERCISQLIESPTGGIAPGTGLLFGTPWNEANRQDSTSRDEKNFTHSGNSELRIALRLTQLRHSQCNRLGRLVFWG